MVTLLRERRRPAVIREHPLAPWLAVARGVLRRVHGAARRQRRDSSVPRAAAAVRHRARVGPVGVARLPARADRAARPGSSRWSDRVGRKLMYLYGFVVFAVSAAACGLALSLAALIALRVVQAVGAAMLQANSVALRGDERARAYPQGGAWRPGGGAGGRPGVRPGDRRPARGGGLLALAVLPQRPPGGARGGGRLFTCYPGREGLPGSPGHPTLGRRATGQPALRRAVPGRPARHRPGRDGPARRRDNDRNAGHLRPVRAWRARLDGGLVRGRGRARGIALLRHERRASAPLLGLRAMAASGTSSALLGALCAYLVLFGPLVLFPQLVSAQGGSAESAGLLLTARFQPGSG